MKILELLLEKRVLDIYQNNAGQFELVEQCDQWYGVTLTKEQMLQLAEEIKELANIG